jgi:hypothetical protein
MRLTTDYTAVFTPFELAGKRLRNRTAHGGYDDAFHACRTGDGASNPVSRQSCSWRGGADGDGTAWHKASPGRSATGASVATGRR